MKDLTMTFINELGDKVGIRVPAVRVNITAAEVAVAMDQVITSNIFQSTGGDLVKKYSAELTERLVNKLEVAGL